jgi:hypothetical protein
MLIFRLYFSSVTCLGDVCIKLRLILSFDDFLYFIPLLLIYGQVLHGIDRFLVQVKNIFLDFNRLSFCLFLEVVVTLDALLDELFYIYVIFLVNSVELGLHDLCRSVKQACLLFIFTETFLLLYRSSLLNHKLI